METEHTEFGREYLEKEGMRHAVWLGKVLAAHDLDIQALREAKTCPWVVFPQLHWQPEQEGQRKMQIVRIKQSVGVAPPPQPLFFLKQLISLASKHLSTVLIVSDELERLTRIRCSRQFDLLYGTDIDIKETPPWARNRS